MNMTDIPTTLAQLNKFVKKKWPEIQVIKGRGYFYLDSRDDDIALKLAGLYSSTLEGMWPMGTITYKQWERSIKDTLDDWQ